MQSVRDITRSWFKSALPLCLLSLLLGTTGAQAQTFSGKFWVTADFNGDQKTDLVTVTSSNATFQAGPLGAAAFTMPLGLPSQRLRARDLDGDSDRDLVLETLSAEPVAVWLNDGAGNFERADLEDFRFQLSHQSPSTVTTAEAVPVPDGFGDVPGTDLDAPPSLSVEAPACGQFACSTEYQTRIAPRFTPCTRGPPQLL